MKPFASQTVDVREMLCAQALAVVAQALAPLPSGARARVTYSTDDVRRDLAVPLYLDIAGGSACAVGILEVEDGKNELRDYFEAGMALPPVFDFVYYTPRWPRPDPCATFKPR